MRFARLGRNRRTLIILLLAGLALFLVWRFIRPMNIFVVEDRFAWPIDTAQASAVSVELSASACGGCHKAFYDEWRTTIHSRAWTDPYFQTDWKFEGAQHICRLCHTPLDRQQPQKVLGYRDKDKWDPILADNPDFDPGLQHEGVTCAACHYREGKIIGVLGTARAPHPVKTLEDPNEICMRCHVVQGERWDTFFRFPPCGTVAEIESSRAASVKRRDRDGPAMPTETARGDDEDATDEPVKRRGESGEITAQDPETLGCVQCHMPMVERALVAGGVPRKTRQHLWRGGHDPEMVRSALTIEFAEARQSDRDGRVFQLTLTNTGAAHYVPTGTPDRHLTVHLRSLDDQGDILDEQRHTISRTVMWRPFIIDLWDNRLVRWQPRHYRLEVPADSDAMKVEVEIRYHLLDENRRERIGYENATPIQYATFSEQIALQ
ncbi:MAG: hypothetical protein PVG38_16885 [Gammaproteobacteria bacterium]|jgi:hypothetical protein